MSPLEVVAVVVWAFAVSAVGGIVGLVLGNLRLPVMLAFATSPAAGAGANVAVSGAAAVTAAARHARAGRILWHLFWLMAPASLVGAIAGGLLSGVIPDEPLLIAIGLVILYGAWEIYRHRPADQIEVEQEAGNQTLAVVATGFGIGLLGGFVGLILGSMRLPAMLRYLRIHPRQAVGTNAAVGAVVGVGGLIGHLPGGIDWGLLGAGCAGAIPGAYLGAHLTGRISDSGLLARLCIRNGDQRNGGPARRRNLKRMGEETALAETDLGTGAVDLLCELIALDTVNPPGNEDRAQDLLAERLRDAGLRDRRSSRPSPAGQPRRRPRRRRRRPDALPARPRRHRSRRRRRVELLPLGGRRRRRRGARPRRPGHEGPGRRRGRRGDLARRVRAGAPSTAR